MIWNLIERNSRPELRSPPPLTPEGKVVTPEPERSFIQKYWVYVLGFVVILGQFTSLAPLFAPSEMTWELQPWHLLLPRKKAAPVQGGLDEAGSEREPMKTRVVATGLAVDEIGPIIIRLLG